MNGRLIPDSLRAEAKARGLCLHLDNKWIYRAYTMEWPHCVGTFTTLADLTDFVGGYTADQAAAAAATRRAETLREVEV